MFAVIQTGGKQYRVTAGDVIQVEKLEGAAGEMIVLENVLAHFDGANSELSAEKLGEARVSAEILEQGKADKIIVFKKKRRHNYRRKNGHRQQVTVLRIGSIALDGKVSMDKPMKKSVKKDEASAVAALQAPDKKPAAKKPAAKAAGNGGVAAETSEA